MNPTEPTDDLESELGTRPLPDTSGPYRQRVLTAMRAELARPTVPDIWRFAGLAAAAVLLAINFSMSVANDADFRLAERPAPAALTATVQELRALSPDLSEDEAFRHALLLHAGAGAAPVPELHAFPTRILLNKEQ